MEGWCSRQDLTSPVGKIVDLLTFYPQITLIVFNLLQRSLRFQSSGLKFLLLFTDCLSSMSFNNRYHNYFFFCFEINVKGMSGIKHHCFSTFQQSVCLFSFSSLVGLLKPLAWDDSAWQPPLHRTPSLLPFVITTLVESWPVQKPLQV